MRVWLNPLWCLPLLLAAACGAALGASSAEQPLSLWGVNCSRLQFSLSQDGARAAVLDAVTLAGGYVSTSPFAATPNYEWHPVSNREVYWSIDDRVIFESVDGYRVVDPVRRSARQIKVGSVRASYFSRDPDIVPRFVDREVFAVRDRIIHNLLAVNIDTGATRVAIDGYGEYSPVHWFVGTGGHEVSRLFVTSEHGRRDMLLAAHKGRGGGIIALETEETLVPLGSAEALALSRTGRFLALNKRVTGERVVVVVDPRTLKRIDLLKLATDGPFTIGATADGGALEWSGQFAPLPTIEFTSAAPEALRAFVEAVPNAWLEFQSQSKDATIRIFKLTELSGRVHFVRLSGGRAEAFDVPCRQPSPQLVATSRPISAAASSDVGWIVRRNTAGAATTAPLVFVLPDETARTINPLLDPFLERLVSEGADVRMLIYPGSWSRGRLGSGANVSVSNLVAFARGAINAELSDATAKGRQVVVVGRGFGALLALHLGSTGLAGRIEGIFAERAMTDVSYLPVAVRRDVDPLFGYYATARGMPVAFFHGASQDRRKWVTYDIEDIMSRRGGGGRMNRCVLVDGMDQIPESAFQWEQESKAFADFLAMVARARAHQKTPSPGARSKCVLVSPPRR